MYTVSKFERVLEERIRVEKEQRLILLNTNHFYDQLLPKEIERFNKRHLVNVEQYDVTVNNVTATRKWRTDHNVTDKKDDENVGRNLEGIDSLNNNNERLSSEKSDRGFNVNGGASFDTMSTTSTTISTDRYRTRRGFQSLRTTGLLS
jgi:hypothetical protein